MSMTDEALTSQLTEENEDMMEGMFLTFMLGEKDAQQSYGLEIYNVTEIIQMQPITMVPDVAEFILGVINLRGKVIPVMDMRSRFHLPPAVEENDRRCIIVVSNDDIETGLIVDEMRDVVYIADDLIQPPPGMEEGRKNRFIKGIGKLEDSIHLLLDLEKFVSLNDQ